jgi:preprotein translocase subunit SecD
VKDRCNAERLVGQTAELRFRPVLTNLPPLKEPTTTTTTTTPGATTTTTTAPATTTTTAPATTTTLTPADQAASAANECVQAAAGNTAKSSKDEAANAAVASCDPNAVLALDKVPTTSREDDKRKACVVLPDKPGGRNAPRYYLGPAGLTGKVVDSAKAEFVSSQGWTVKMDLTDSGSSKWDQLAQEQFHKQVAITLDSVVQSAPTIQPPPQQTFESFNGTAIISGRFSQAQAEDLAKLINYGALPVQLKKISVENVSPTLGQDQLDAGIAAGILGLALVAAYMLFFYRLLGLVVIAGLLLSGMALYVIVTYLGQSAGLALTLAGVTGIIVSVGVTVDSYVVYYERLKDEVRAGSTVRACVDRAFTRSFRTILAADLVSLIGAAVLYLLAIGSVRGFALFLGLSTVLDLIVAYFFMHPLVSIMARNPDLVRMRGVGIAAGLDAPGVTA